MGALSALERNSTRVSLLIDYLNLHVKQIYQTEHTNFCNLCFSLARCIDFAVANNNIPSKAKDLPVILRQIRPNNNSHYAKAATMVLMLSIKNACKSGWFSDKESEELCSLVNELGNEYFGCGDVTTGHSSFHSTMTAIMERFYPRLKMGQILASVEIKAGYGVFAIDFHVSKTMQHSPQEKIRLFVAQKDNIETSACIISPSQVNFLINGKGVNGRTNVYMDTGPQLPTNISHMIKFGPNLLQAVGNFNGHYVIAIAFMNTAPAPDSSGLQNYVQPAVATVDPDSDIIEGPSRISLNCPISYTRIKVPVKGHSCKHLQCFDFHNFVDINSRRPSWRCPHCNQHISYSDICVDQDMSKVLREVAENVTEVIISADGSWKAILENDNGDVNSMEDSVNHDRPEQESSAPIDVLDLTEADDHMDTIMDAVCSSETVDRKPSNNLGKNQSVPTSVNVSSGMNAGGINQEFGAVLEDDFWSGIVNDGILTSCSMPTAPMGSTIPAAGFTGHMQSAASTPAFHDQSILQMQASNSTENNQYGRVPLINIPVTRTPIAVQALPAQPQVSGQQHGSRPPTVLSAPQVGQGMTTNVDGLNAVSRGLERSQQFSRHHVNPHHATNLNASFQRPSTTQNRDLQERSFNPGQPVHQASTALRALSDFRNAHLQQALNLRIPLPRNQSARLVQPPLQFPQTMGQVGGAFTVAAYTAMMGSKQRPRMTVTSPQAEMLRQPTGMPSQNQASRSYHPLQTATNGPRTPTGELRNSRGVSQPIPVPDGSVDSSLEQNWQPTGRMRGSLAGRPYSAALSQMMIQPTQSVQPARPSYVTNPASSSRDAQL